MWRHCLGRRMAVAAAVRAGGITALAALLTPVVLPPLARPGLALPALPVPPAPGCPAPLIPLALGLAMLLLSAALHTAATVLQAELSHRPQLRQWWAPRSNRRLLLILVTALVLALLLDILLWALLYRQLGLFETLGTSLYVSGITFTSVGYGDLTLPFCWRLLSVLEAVNGMLMAGWSTAQLVYAVQRVMQLRLQQEAPSAAEPSTDRSQVPPPSPS